MAIVTDYKTSNEKCRGFMVFLCINCVKHAARPGLEPGLL